MYAVIEDGSHQYRVEVGQKLDVDYRESVQPDEELVFERVLLCRTADGVHVGQPVVEEARVVARVLEHVKGPKIYVEKFKRRKNYRRRKGHRQRATRVLIERIEIGGVVVAGPALVESRATQEASAGESADTSQSVEESTTAASASPEASEQTAATTSEPAATSEPASTETTEPPQEGENAQEESKNE